jgi:hypothetical protein
MFGTLNCPKGASSIDYKKVNVRACRTACIVGLPPFQWDVAPERYGFCGNCEHEFGDGETTFCNRYFKDKKVYLRYYCNKECARYGERERLRPAIQKYAGVLQDWKDLLDRVLQLRNDPNPPIGSFSSVDECTRFVKLQRRIASLLQNAVACILKRDTPMYLLYKARLQEEWVELLARCKTDAMTMRAADEMTDFGNICTVARFFVNDAAAEE